MISTIHQMPFPRPMCYFFLHEEVRSRKSSSLALAAKLVDDEEQNAFVGLVFDVVALGFVLGGTSATTSACPCEESL